MKKIINGKRYDTDTATRVGQWDNGYYGNDFRQCCESLYRKKTGEFFLYGDGGPLTVYASHHGNSSGWGEDIRVLTVEEAREWAERHLDADEYERWFDVEPDEEPDAPVKDLRLHTGLSQAAFADRFGIPFRTLQDWEAGRRTPPAYVIDLLRYRIETDDKQHNKED